MADVFMKVQVMVIFIEGDEFFAKKRYVFICITLLYRLLWKPGWVIIVHGSHSKAKQSNGTIRI